MKAVLLVSHGSRSAKTKEEVLELISVLKSRSGVSIFECAFLELEHPGIPDGIDLCVNKGARDIVILLNFLNSGRHVNTDIPEIVKESAGRHPNVKLSITGPVGQHPKIADLFLDLLNHA